MSPLQKPYRTITVAILVLITFISVTARNKVIENPQFETRASSVLTIERIELSDTATRIDFHAIFRPQWWIKVDSTFKIIDSETSISLQPIRAEGITLEEQFWMPESGEHKFSLFFPPLPDSTKKIDIKDGDSITIYGVSLEESAATNPSETIQATESTYAPFGGGFFTPGTTRLHGKILNYDRRTGPDVLLIYVKNFVTREDIPKAISIKDDGTFDKEIYIPSPQTCSWRIGGCFMSTYLEQGNDLELIIDWEDILHIDRMRGLIDKIPNIRFGGSLASINRDLYNAPLYEYIDVYKMAQEQLPIDAKNFINKSIDKWKESIDRYKSETGINGKSAQLLNQWLVVQRGYKLLDYDMYRTSVSLRDTTENELFMSPIPVEYYRDFLTEIMGQDTTLLATVNAGILLNRIAHSALTYRYSTPIPTEGSYTAHLQKELQSMTDSVKQFIGADSTPLIWQLAMCNRVSYTLMELAKSGDELHAKETLTSLKDGAVPDPTLQAILDDYCDSLISIKPYALPDTEAGRVMSDIIAPHKGKLLIIDFWGTGCGPCRQAIEASKEFRNKHRDHPDFKIIYITGEDESPRASYDKYVAKNLQGETCHYLSTSDISRLRELFGISGIPHYILIDREGKVANDNFNFYFPQEALLKEGVRL